MAITVEYNAANDYEPDNVNLKYPWSFYADGTYSKSVDADAGCDNGKRFRMDSTANVADCVLSYSQPNIDGNNPWHDYVSNFKGYTITLRFKVIDSSSHWSQHVEIYDGTYRWEFMFTDAKIFVPADGIAEAQQEYAMNTTDAYHKYELIVIGNSLIIKVDGTIRITGTLNWGTFTESLSFGDNNYANTRGGEVYWDYIKYAIVPAYNDSAIRYRKGDTTYKIAGKRLLPFHKLRLRVPNFNIIDEVFDNLIRWADADVEGVSSQVTFDGQETLKLDSGLSVGNWFRYANRNQNVGGFPANFTVKIKVYCDSIGGSDDDLKLWIYNGVIIFAVSWRSTGLFISKAGAAKTEVGTDLVVQDTWQTWKFVVTAGAGPTATCDVYLNDDLVGENIDCGWESSTSDGYCVLKQYGYDASNRISYIDYLKITANNITLNWDFATKWHSDEAALPILQEFM